MKSKHMVVQEEQYEKIRLICGASLEQQLLDIFFG